jgi:hypothetical protein
VARTVQTGPPAPLLTSAQQVAIAISTSSSAFAYEMLPRTGIYASREWETGKRSVCVPEFPTLKQRN